VARNTKLNGGSYSPTYRTWIGMRTRCNNPNTPYYVNYGGRGIKVCPEWESFDAFLRDMGERPSSDHSLHRIDNDGNYEPGNCKWAIETEQQRNKRNNHYIEIDGKRRSLTEVAEAAGLKPNTLLYRLKRGSPVGRAVDPAPMPRGRRSVPEWIGKTPDTQIPARVKLRIKARANNRCQSCKILVRGGGEFDHRPALINGGENRESKIEFLCRNCHVQRTKEDMALKSRSAKTQRSVAGFDTISPFRQLREKLNLKWNWKTRRYERVLPEATTE
jgi:hypothetical protein